MRVREGGVANFTVLRAGRTDFVTSVMYRVAYGNTSPDDLSVLSNDTLLVYGVGEWMKNISAAVEDDDIPETDETFYIILYNATGECNPFELGEGLGILQLKPNTTRSHVVVGCSFFMHTFHSP